MDTGLTFLGALEALFFFGGILSALVLPGWLQRRRREVATHQIALTDALDDEVGPIVAPVVRRRLWGPWRVEIAVPLGRPETVGRIVAISNEVLSAAEGIGARHYRILLTKKQDTASDAKGATVGRPAGRWAGRAAAA
jgi:hypothetical protein